MNERPLHAVLLPQGAAGGRMLDLLGAALDGSGPAIAPLDPTLPPARLRDLVETLRPAAVETTDGVSPPESVLGGDPRPAGVAADTAVVIATSGSTGRPKGVELSAAALRHSARASLARVGARGGERWLLCLPVTHIAGIGVLVRSIVSGTDPVIRERLDAATLRSADCAHVSLVPTQLRRLLDADDGEGLWRGYRSVLLGGAATPAGLLAAASAARVPVVTTYGMTETCGGCVYDGTPLDGVSLRTGDDGRVRISGPVLFNGYRLRPDLTAAACDDGWFVTSDLGDVDGSGRLTVRGRTDDVINTGGEKVVATEVAAALEGCPGIGEVVVVGRPDQEWGERVTAIVVPVDHSAPPTLESARRHVRGLLPRYAAPRELVVVTAMPMLSSGKPDLEALRWEHFPAESVSR